MVKLIHLYDVLVDDPTHLKSNQLSERIAISELTLHVDDISFYGPSATAGSTALYLRNGQQIIVADTYANIDRMLHAAYGS